MRNCQLKFRLTLTIFLCICYANAFDISVNSGGYEGVVVAINRNVPEDPKIIQGIKEMFIRGSGYLFNATRNRLYFKKVTIVIPESWNGSYDQEDVFTDYYSKSHIRIAPANPEFGDAPYTLQPGECGDQGEYVHFTPKFVSEFKGWTFEMYGDSGRQLVHEWSHFRFGVYDEYGTPGNRRFPLFYLDKGKVHPTSCVKNVKGWIEQDDGFPCKLYKNGFVGDECRFIPEMDEFLQPVEASIMYMPYLPKVGSFCNGEAEEVSKQHNWRAPTKQNAFCKYRSTWEVISNHPDMLKSSVLSPNTPTKTSFLTLRFAGVKARQTVLLMDVSTSMSTKSRLRKLQAAAQRFIMDTIPSYTSFGMVQFSTKARKLASMIRIENHDIRKNLAKLIPYRVSGSTSIGAGLRESIKTLQQNSGKTKGAMIILLTDGEETDAPFISDVLKEIEESGVIVNTIAIGDSATVLLESLATRTGGRSFYFPDSDKDASGLDSALGSSTSSQVDVELQPITVFGNNIEISAGELKTIEVNMDKELGKNAEFTISGSSIKDIFVTLKSPGNKVYDESHPEFDVDIDVKQRKKFTFPLAEHGKWMMMLKASKDVSIVATVSSDVRDPSEQPIRAVAWFDKTEVTFPAYVKVLAKVSKGYNEVLDATVKATIIRPNEMSVDIMLKDNGVGADTIENDGIYSGYFSNFTGNGRYAAVATVVNDGKAKLKISGGGFLGKASGAPSIPRNKTHLNMEPQFEFETNMFTRMPGSIPDPLIETETAEAFSRNVNMGNFQLKKFAPGMNKDVIPPSRVTDLEVYHISKAFPQYSKSLTVIYLRWTAAGDDLDAGIADHVEIRGAAEGESLLRGFGSCSIMSNVRSMMKPSGKQQKAQFYLPEAWDNKNCTENDCDVYFALISVDKMGNKAEMSNIAVAHLGSSAFSEAVERTISTIKEQPEKSSVSGENQQTSSLFEKPRETTYAPEKQERTRSLMDDDSEEITLASIDGINNISISENQISISEENAISKSFKDGDSTLEISVGDKKISSISLTDEDESTVRLKFIRTRNITIKDSKLYQLMRRNLLKKVLSE